MLAHIVEINFEHCLKESGHEVHLQPVMPRGKIYRLENSVKLFSLILIFMTYFHLFVFS